MQFKSIKVSAGRTVPHPIESYSNLRIGLVLAAEITEDEDVDAATRQLQAKAEGLVDDHAETLTKTISERYHTRRKMEELASLERDVATAQARLEYARQNAHVSSVPQIPAEIMEDKDRPF